MALHICILLNRNSVIEASNIEALGDEDALTQTIALC